MKRYMVSVPLCVPASMGPQQQTRYSRFAVVCPAGRDMDRLLQHRRANAGSATSSPYVVAEHRLVDSAQSGVCSHAVQQVLNSTDHRITWAPQQRLWSYDLMALYKSVYCYYYNRKSRRYAGVVKLLANAARLYILYFFFKNLIATAVTLNTSIKY